VDSGHFNVTDEVRPFLGPSEKAHQTICPITPKQLGYQQLEISTITGNTYTFRENDEIIIDE
jgi:hypothetical protein